jgi:hypothetical protein
MRAGALLRHGKFRLRVDYGGTVSIVVTTEAVTVDYKHRPIHEKAPNRRADVQLKDISKTKGTAAKDRVRAPAPAPRINMVSKTARRYLFDKVVKRQRKTPEGVARHAHQKTITADGTASC